MGGSKEAIAGHLTHKQVKRLTDKEVEKLYKQYKTYGGGGQDHPNFG